MKLNLILNNEVVGSYLVSSHKSKEVLSKITKPGKFSALKAYKRLASLSILSDPKEGVKIDFDLASLTNMTSWINHMKLQGIPATFNIEK